MLRVMVSPHATARPYPDAGQGQVTILGWHRKGFITEGQRTRGPEKSQGKPRRRAAAIPAGNTHVPMRDILPSGPQVLWSSMVNPGGIERQHQQRP